MWKNIVEPGSPKTTIWRMRIACWIPKATKTLSEYVMLIALPLQQGLHERPSVLVIRTLPVLQSFFRFLAYTSGTHCLTMPLALAFRRVLFNEPPFEGRRVDVDGDTVAADCKKFSLSCVKICHVVQSAPYK